MGVRRLTSLLVLIVTMGIATNVQAQVTHNSITLHWTTPGDDGLSGTASDFDLRYSASPIAAGNFASAARWTSMPAPAVAGTRQNVTITGLQPSTTYYFAIKTADEVPNWSALSNVFQRTTLAAPDEERPAQIATLAITGATDSTATLQWTAVGDDSLTGTADSYDLRYSAAPITSQNWSNATRVSGEPGPASPGTSQSMTVTGLSREVTYYFAIRAEDEAGNPSALSNVPSVTTPDTTAPAAIIDLGVSFIWIEAPVAMRPAAVEVPRR